MEDAAAPLDDLDDLDITTEGLSLEGLERELQGVENNAAIEQILGSASLSENNAALGDHARLIESHLRDAELASVDDYVSVSDNLGELSEQITQCDSILAVMEQTLHDFQHDLGTISAQIQGLQTQSASMGIKLRNRKAVTASLGEFLSAAVVPTELVEGIVEEDVTEAYLEHLLTLSKKLSFCSSQGAGTGDCVALNDVLPALEKLRTKSCAKVREFLLKKVHALRKPGTNVQMIQRNVLLKYRHFARYLRQHGAGPAESVALNGGDEAPPNALYVELQTQYADAVGGGLKGNFEAYVEALPRLRADPGTHGDVLGSASRIAGSGTGGPGGSAQNLSAAVSQAAVGMTGAFAEAAGALGAMFQGPPGGATNGAGSTGRAGRGGTGGAAPAAAATASSHGPFRLGDRAALAFAHLTEGGSPALVPHLEFDARRYHPFERMFASAHKLLADTATSEYLFIGDFFGERGLFNTVFEGPLAAVERWVISSVNEPHNVYVDSAAGDTTSTPGVPIGVTTYGDAIGCLLCIAGTQRLRMTMSKRRVPALDSYLDRILMVLWPRAKALLEAHIASLEEPRNVATVLRSAATSGGTIDPRRSDLPRVAKSCGELLASCRLMAGSVGDGQLGGTLERLRQAAVGFVRVCAGLGIHGPAGAATGDGAAPAAVSAAPANLALVVHAYHALNGALVAGAADEMPSDEASTLAAAEGTVGPTDAPVAADIAYFGALLAKARSDWVERVLGNELEELIAFVRWAEKADDAERDAEGPKRGGVALRLFAERWSAAIGNVKAAVEVSFGPIRADVDEDLPAALLKQALTQLLLYYTRAKEALARCGERGEKLVAEVGVAMPALLYEVQRAGGNAQ